MQFLSTLSLRRATRSNQSIVSEANISIHALLAESDPGKVRVVEPGLVFLSTLSLRRATAEISPSPSHRAHFYPRSPCGERQPAEHHASSQQEFLSTLSLRRATSYQQPCGHPTTDFYPRSPCGERLVSVGLLMFNLYFYPRSPCGERHAWHRFAMRRDFISIHALLAESDDAVQIVVVIMYAFLSTLSLRRATALACSVGFAS